MSKINLNSEIPMPVSMTIHDLVTACGYEMVRQYPDILFYHNGDREIRFSTDKNVFDESIYLKVVTNGFCLEMFKSISDEQLASMLQALEEIDFSTLKEFKDGQHFANNTGFSAEHIGMVAPGGNTGFFGIRNDKGDSPRH